MPRPTHVVRTHYTGGAVHQATGHFADIKHQWEALKQDFSVVSHEVYKAARTVSRYSTPYAPVYLPR